MIISHKHRYVFVELAHTASSALNRELCENYDGQPILTKHSTYRDFLKVASEDEKSYFVFSCIRNPLDLAVTKYFKYKLDPNKRRTDPGKVERYRGLGNAIDRWIFRVARESNEDFGKFFLKVYRLPYNSWACLDHKKFDYILLFENLEHDFEELLRRLGVEQKRPLPRFNATAQRKREFTEYYSSPEVVERAKRVFGVYMQEWGYEFPPDWGKAAVTRRDRIAYDAWSFFMKLYWRYLKPWMFSEIRVVRAAAEARSRV